MKNAICIKTGCTARLGPGHWAHGDLFELPGYGFLFRICDVGEVPQRERFNCRVASWDLWMDESKTSMQQNSTMTIMYRDMLDYSYEGHPIREAMA